MHFLGRRHGDIFRHRRRDVRTIYAAVSSLHHPRDRGLDHSVEREKHLKPVFNLKNLIIAEPSKSIPLSIITDSRQTLNIPFRPVEFIRKYPSIFHEFYPGSLNIQPHIKATDELISLNAEEDSLYETVSYKENVAVRLLKLLMIGRRRKVPIFVLERLKWELGLMKDYEKSLIPEFPDYFRVVNGDLGRGNGKMLELVCWGEEFAVSEIEKKCANDERFEFSIKYPNELETDKKYKKWVDEWQKLPYLSPYKDSMHLAAKSNESDKWTVALLHELLHLFVGKKIERDNLLFLGEWLGLRSRFKLSLLQHPGIFYVSGKIGTHTVILKEAYKRGALAESEPLMDIRFKYAQLMNAAAMKEDEKNKNDDHKKAAADAEKGEEEENLGDGGEDTEEEGNGSDENPEPEGENPSRRGNLKFFRNAAAGDREGPRKFRRGFVGDRDLSGNNGDRDRDRRNMARRGRDTRNGDGFGENARGRRRGGRDREEGAALKRDSRRVNVRNGGSNVPVRARRKPDFSGDRIGLRTEKN